MVARAAPSTCVCDGAGAVHPPTAKRQDSTLVPDRVRVLEPVVCLALAGHAVAVLSAVRHQWAPLIVAAAVTLLVLGVAGLAGARSSRALITRGTAILGLGFFLQLVRADAGGYFLLWFFVLVSVYPAALTPRLGRLVPILAPAAYLALLPWHAVDGPYQIAVLRALTLALDGAFVYMIAAAFRATSADVLRSQASALEALTTLQTALLPPQVVSHPGVVVAARYKAAGIFNQVGGDWYDTIPLPAGGLAVVIGDVEGHDLTAASVMGLVRGAVHAYALEGHPPAIVVERVNTFLLSTGVERLVTMAYVQLYPHQSIATVVLAGHPAPLLVPRTGPPVTALDIKTGALLGLPPVSCTTVDYTTVDYTTGPARRGPARCDPVAGTDRAGA